MKPGLIPALVGLRGLAALMALWGRLGFVPFPVLRPLLQTDIADDLFFCLSGFLLCRAHDAGAAARLPARYWRKRACRLAPAGALLLVSGLAPPVWPVLALLLCYVAIFPLFFAAAKRPLARRVALPVGVTLALAAAVIWLEPGWNPLRLAPHVVAGMTAAALFIVLAHGVMMFLAGACAGLLWRRDDELTGLAADAVVAAGLAAGFTLAGCCLGVNPGEFAGVAAPALVLGLAAAPGGAAARLLATPPLRSLGQLAYPLYLLFGPVQAVLAWAAPALPLHQEANAAATVAVLLLAAAAAKVLWLELKSRAGFTER